LECAKRIKCPVVAIHGDFDSHPVEGVVRPLEGKVTSFRWYVIENCGHYPWIERRAREGFFLLLKKELRD
jgi:pimeloyl-ACP methyl ester carboxylesterase